MFTQSWLLTKSSSSDSLPSSSPHRVSPPTPAKAGGKEGICHQDYDRLRLRHRHRHRHRHCHHLDKPMTGRLLVSIIIIIIRESSLQPPLAHREGSP